MPDNRNNSIIRLLVGMGLEVAATIPYVPKLWREIRKALESRVEDGRKYLAFLHRETRHRFSNWASTEKNRGGRNFS